MDDLKNNIGKNIRILRKQRGQTLKSLSEQIGITHQQLSRIENGGGTSTSTLERISALLDVDMAVLIDEPEATLHNTIEQTKNFIPETVCNSMYSKLFNDVIKPANDVAIDKFIESICSNIVQNKELTRNLMCTHAGTKSKYEFTPSALLDFCQNMYVEFADYAIRLSKVDPDNTNEAYWKDED